MFTRSVLLQGAILFALWPVFSMAASFPTIKRSTLPCLVGNPGFAELLIKNNPKLSGKAYLLSDAVLWHLQFSVKRPIGPLSKKEIKIPSFEKFNTWEERLDHIIKQVDSVSDLSALFEGGIYFNRFSMLYFSTKGSYVFVLGNDNQPFNINTSIGKFPIHFGSGLSEYPFGTLQAGMGVAATCPSISCNLENHWKVGHISNLRFFGFKQNIITKALKEKTEKQTYKESYKESYKGEKLGVNFNHKWKPLSKEVDNVNVGIAWVSGLPTAEAASSKENPDGIDLYCHIDAGPLKAKVEFMASEAQKRWGSIWSKKKRKASESRSSDNASLLSRGRQRKRSLSRDGKSKDTNRREILSPDVIHGEISYKLPFKKDSTAVLGYAWGNSEFLIARERYFLGFKMQLLENLNCLVGYQGDKDMKEYKKGKVAPGRVTYEEENRYDGKWRHSFTLQISCTL